MIEINPRDLDGMRDLMQHHKDYPTMLLGKNEDNETTFTSINKDNIVVETIQKNGWTRKNIYYYDGTSEEMYER